MNRAFVIGCWILIVTFGISGGAKAQKPGSQFTVSGVVQDPSGAVITTAAVELRSKEGNVQSATTDGSGSFRFQRVSPGTYQIHIQSAGFNPADIPLQITSQPPTPFHIVLAVAGLNQEATISAEATQLSTETADNQNSNSLTGQALSNLPVFDQDYIGTMSRFLDAGSVGTAGATLVVDGMEVNSLGVSASAIKELIANCS